MDITATVALVISLIALLVTVVQVTQQLLATGYVIRKCDAVISGGVTRGGARTFHWRQFRFTVHYQVPTFSFPSLLYAALGVSPAIMLASSDIEVAERGGKPHTQMHTDAELWERAEKLHRTRTSQQGSWVSFLQDMLPCLQPHWLGTKWESGDRIPDDLTVAPAQVDILTVMLLSVASGLQLTKYSPAEGEINMAGLLGAVTSSRHPVLGCLMHYTPMAQYARLDTRTRDLLRLHAKAVGEGHGVWANAVFGKFNDRTYGRGFMSFTVLRNAKVTVLKENGWPWDSVTDTYGGAAGFLAFGTVDVYECVPPTCVRRWSAHFAEMIVRAHLEQIKGKSGTEYPASFISRRKELIENFGASSPLIDWDMRVPISEKSTLEEKMLNYYELNMFNADMPGHLNPAEVANPELVAAAAGMMEDEDPSSFVPVAAAYEVILRCDRAMYSLASKNARTNLKRVSLHLVAKAISVLAEAGAPSWRQATHLACDWPRMFADVVTKAKSAYTAGRRELALDSDVPFDDMVFYAELFVLRAAYFTVMLRSAGELGPGLEEDTKPVTALAYLA